MKYILVIGLTITSFAWAKKEVSEKFQITKIDETFWAADENNGTSETYTVNHPKIIEANKYWTKEGRKLASSDDASLALDEAATKLLESWNGSKTPADMDQFFYDYENAYKNFETAAAKDSTKKLSPKAAYIYNYISLLKPFRSLVWKVRPIFEKKFSGLKAPHLAAVQMVRALVSNLSLVDPSGQWNNGMRFLTEPSSNMTETCPSKVEDTKSKIAYQLCQFHTIQEFQQYVSRVIIPSLELTRNRIAGLYANNPNTLFVIDYDLLFGLRPTSNNSYGGAVTLRKDLPKVSRYVGHGGAEILLADAAIRSTLHDLRYFTAMNLDQLLKAVSAFQKNLGMDSVFGQNDELGFTSMERHKIVLPYIAHGLFKIKDKTALSQAYTNLKESIKSATAAHTILQNRPNSIPMGLTPVFYQDSNRPALARTIENLNAMVDNDKATVIDILTGDWVTVSIHSLYGEAYANQTIANLTPVSFSTTPQEKCLHENKVCYRDYFAGQATGWNNEEWSKFVPSAADSKDPAYMKKALRILRFTYGSSMLTTPINMFVR